MELNIEIDQIIEVYTDLDDDTFWLGKVSAYDDEYLLIREISTFGEQDGIVLVRTNDIFKIEYDTIYSKKISKLAKLLNEKEVKYQFSGDFPVCILEASRKEKKIIDIQLCGRSGYDVSGIVDNVKDGICIIKQITSDAEEDGFCRFKVSDIDCIRYDSLENRKLEEKIKNSVN